MPDQDGRLRVGVIGTGGIARSEHLPHWRTSPDAVVAALADSDPAALAKARALCPEADACPSAADLLSRPDLDVVDICTPNALHAPLALAALVAGKHVLVEKPMATVPEDARAMAEAAARAGRTLMVNHVFRFHPDFAGLRALADTAGLGEVYHVQARWTRRRGVPPAPTFIARELAGAGPALDLGIHLIDLALVVLGPAAAGPVQVLAAAHDKLAHQPGLGGEWGDWDRDAYDVEDYAVALCRFAGGATLALETGWLAFQPTPEERHLHVLGTRGGFRWPDGSYASERANVPFNLSLAPRPVASPFQQAVHAFARAARAGLPAPIPPAETVRAVELADAVLRAGRSGSLVLLP